MITDIPTYRHLAAALQAMTDEQLNQPVQIADPPADCRPVELLKGLAIATVGELEFAGSRSVVDNRYHADDVVLLVDANPFADDGAVAYELRNEGPKDGTPIMRHVPIYDADGPTPREAQMASDTNE